MKRVRFASDLFSYCDVLGANVKSSESPLSNVSETVKLSIDIKYQNINGLGDKLGQSDVLADILSRDITIYAEAMKGPNFTCDIPGYWVKSYPHSSHDKCKGRVPGGFVLIVKSSIKKNVKVVKQNDHVVWLCLTNLVEHSCNKIFVGSVYVPHAVNALNVGHWSNDLGFSKMTGVPARDIGHLSGGVSKLTLRKYVMSYGYESKAKTQDICPVPQNFSRVD